MSEPLSRYTTLRLGGPARTVETVSDAGELVSAVREAAEEQRPVLLIAGGSNLVVSDAGFDGTALLVRTTGVEIDGTTITAQAGENWDELVLRAVSAGLSGIEALSGIPGSVGATPIQNVGAYGQEVAETIAAVRILDRRSDRIETLGNDECGFGYRTSAFKRDPGRWVVLEVTFELSDTGESAPVAYAQLAAALGVSEGDRVPLADVREAVLELRRSKGMVLDGEDPDTRSAGSFFTNPFVDAAALERIAGAAGMPPPAWADADRFKTSAAWLIERAGFQRGQGDPQGIAISSKHVLALTNRGNGTTAELLAMQDEIVDAVRERFGVTLEREPTLV